MNWLFKEEPTHYGYDDFVKDGRTRWSGVRNPLAQKHLRSVKKGDRVFYYHTGDEKAIVGINPGLRSAATGHHFAGYSNRFWKLLRESNLVPGPVTFLDDGRLSEWGLGITNLVPRASRGIDELCPGEYQAGRRALFRKVARYRPEVLALVGVTLYRTLFVNGESDRRLSGPLRLGLQPEVVSGARLFVLPNPSGRNAHYSYDEMLDAFVALRRYLASHSRRRRTLPVI